MIYNKKDNDSYYEQKCFGLCPVVTDALAVKGSANFCVASAVKKEEENALSGGYRCPCCEKDRLNVCAASAVNEQRGNVTAAIVCGP